MQKFGTLHFNDWLVRFAAAALILLIVSSTGITASAKAGKTDLTQLSLEDLMNITITSVSKKAQPLSDAPAAVFVITADDIRRSGATSIADALRMVPGLQVAKLDANKWAITSRGFNGRFANKLLVLMDGRSIYTPWFSGVFWETVDTMLEDIERIEVIRGPGASLWGANAVNGVINIITRKAQETQGGLLAGTIGTEERGIGALRYGTRIGKDTALRAYAKYINRDAAVDATGHNTADDWHIYSGGFRMDSQLSGRDKLLLEGGLFDGETGAATTFPQLLPPFEQTLDAQDDHRGYHLLTRWQRSFSDTADMALQFYYNYEDRFASVSRGRGDTYDLDFQHHFTAAKRHEIVWGLGYRYFHDKIDDNPDFFSMDPSQRGVSTFNTFVQDDISFLNKRLHFVVGSKFEYNDYTHLEIQPTGRILWKPAENHSLWVAVSRAVRTPSRGERDANVISTVLPPGTVPGAPLPAAITTLGSDNFTSESLTAYEMGYRFRAAHAFSLDVAAYYNDYSDLRSVMAGLPSVAFAPTAPHLVIPFTIENRIDGQQYGLELSANWRPTDKIRLQAAYTYTLPDLKNETSSTMNGIVGPDIENPRHQVSLRAGLDLWHNTTLDLWWRYVDNLGELVDSYHTLDVRLGWEPIPDLEIAIVGQNLIENHHPEFVPEFFSTEPTEVQRGVYVKVTWKF